MLKKLKLAVMSALMSLSLIGSAMACAISYPLPADVVFEQYKNDPDFYLMMRFDVVGAGAADEYLIYLYKDPDKKKPDFINVVGYDREQHTACVLSGGDRRENTPPSATNGSDS